MTLPSRRRDNRPSIKIDRSTLEQDKFLDRCQQQEILLTLHLEGDVQINGLVHRHDRKVIEFGGKNPLKPPRLVSKSAIVFAKVNAPSQQDGLFPADLRQSPTNR